MSEIDLYRSVHKAQRARLFALVVEAGRTDPQDADASATVAAVARALAAELHEHGEHEDRFIHPLLATHEPDLAAALADEHQALDAALAELRLAAGRRDALGAGTLYRVACRFTATYLGHLEREEAESMPALWAHATDDELRAVLMAFHDSRSDLENVTAALGQLATLSPREAAAMVAVAFDAAPLRETRELLTGLLPAPQLRAVFDS
jgi:hypothetical protein